MPIRIDRELRREQIAQAVWEVIVSEGMGAVSVRTVAARAGIAVGSLRHLFPTRDELIEFSAGLMITRPVARIREIPAGDEPITYALRACSELLPLTPDSRAELEVNLALLAEAPAVPRLVEIRDEAYRQLHEFCRSMLALVGQVDGMAIAELRVRRFHALLDGIAMHLLVEPTGEGQDWALDLLRAELERPAG